SFPPDRAIVDDSVHIQVAASDNDVVDYVEILINNVLMEEMTDNSSPFEFTCVWSDAQIGDSTTIQLEAFDKSGNSRKSSQITVFYRWNTIVPDGDENTPRNLESIHYRSSDTHLDFRLKTYENWGNPYDSEEGIDCAIFFDTDSDAETGFSEEAGYSYSPNDIGAEYACIAGIEGDSLMRWSSEQEEWLSVTSIENICLNNDTNYFEISIPLESFDNVQTLDVVFGIITFSGDETFYDWCPDNGHLAYTIDSLYVGDKGIENHDDTDPPLTRFISEERKRWLKKENQRFREEL
ncbi:Ig-like domain-containing protein, partial [Calditrichota bacterium]